MFQVFLFPLSDKNNCQIISFIFIFWEAAWAENISTLLIINEYIIKLVKFNQLTMQIGIFEGYSKFPNAI